MAACFELKRSNDGQFGFVLKAGNGEPILSSEMYTSKASAENGSASVQTNSPIEMRYERKTASNGQLFFNLKGANLEVLGSSQMYASTSGRDDGIASVQKNGATQTVIDLT